MAKYVVHHSKNLNFVNNPPKSQIKEVEASGYRLNGIFVQFTKTVDGKERVILSIRADDVDMIELVGE